MKLTWLTDIHLNFLEKNKREEFYQKIISVEPDAVLITGDIAEAPSIEDMMKEMVSYLHKPIYFVLGNHDYYFGEVAEVREAMITLTQTNNKLYWLPASGVQQLTNEIILLGQDGWADGRLGDYENSRVSLNDSRLINDLFQKKLLGRMQLLKKMQELADVDAAKLHDDLIKAVQLNPKKIIVLTHVPPFREACMHLGKISDEDYLPFFGSKATGDVLTEIAEKNPHIEFLVFCGHTHSESQCQPVSNLIVEAGNAEYYHPAVQKIIKI